MRDKFINVDVFTLCFGEKMLPEGDLAFIFRGQWHWLKWTRFSPSDLEGGFNNNAYRGVSPTFQQFPTLPMGPKQSSAIAVFIQRKLLSWFFAKASRLVSQFWTKAEVNSTSFSVELSYYCIFTNFFRARSVFLSTVCARISKAYYMYGQCFDFEIWRFQIWIWIFLALCKIEKVCGVYTCCSETWDNNKKVRRRRRKKCCKKWSRCGYIYYSSLYLQIQVGYVYLLPLVMIHGI